MIRYWQVGDEIRVDLLSYGESSNGFSQAIGDKFVGKNASAVGVSLKETNPGKGGRFPLRDDSALQPKWYRG